MFLTWSWERKKLGLEFKLKSTNISLFNGTAIYDKGDYTDLKIKLQIPLNESNEITRIQQRPTGFRCNRFFEKTALFFAYYSKTNQTSGLR